MADNEIKKPGRPKKATSVEDSPINETSTDRLEMEKGSNITLEDMTQK